MKNNYEIHNKTGQGGFGTIYNGIKKKTKESVIIKKIPSEIYQMEVFFLQKCQKNRNVIRLIDVFESDSFIYIVMENLINHIDLFDLISSFFPLNEQVIRLIFRETVKCTIDLSKKDIYHFDIKDENIILSYNNEISGDIIPACIKIIDFGNARYGSKFLSTPFSPTLVYCPPEYVNSKLVLCKEFTVWSLGCLLYNLLTGDVPFEIEEICSKKLIWPKLDLPKDLIDVTEKCLIKDPIKRINLEELALI